MALRSTTALNRHIKRQAIVWSYIITVQYQETIHSTWSFIDSRNADSTYIHSLVILSSSHRPSQPGDWRTHIQRLNCVLEPIGSLCSTPLHSRPRIPTGTLKDPNQVMKREGSRARTERSRKSSRSSVRYVKMRSDGDLR